MPFCNCVALQLNQKVHCGSCAALQKLNKLNCAFCAARLLVKKIVALNFETMLLMLTSVNAPVDFAFSPRIRRVFNETIFSPKF